MIHTFSARIWLSILLVLATGTALANGNPNRDQKLQSAAERSMAGRRGALVVVDVVSRNILAAYELETASRQTARPGSTVKPFVLMELLRNKKIGAADKLLCRRPLWIGGIRMDCPHPATVRLLDAEEAIAYSCNSYFAQASSRLTPPELVRVLRQAGFDSPSGLVPDEASGRIENPGDSSALALEALGDRGIEVTPLELLEAYRRLALRKRSESLGDDAPVFAGLEQSVAYGMAHAAHVAGMNIAGKTGTTASRDSAQTHGFFAGYAPAEKPEIAIVVYLERGRGSDAASAAQSVFAEFAASKVRR